MRSIVFSCSLFLSVLLQNSVSPVQCLVPGSPIKTAKHNQNKFVSVQTACSKQAMMSVVVLKDPFHGVMYARGYPLDCASVGNGSREIRLTVGVNQCGTKITEREDGSLQYDVLIYVQYDRHVQQAADELLLVQCSPQEVVVSGRMAPASHQVNNHQEFEYSSTSSTVVPQSTIDAWMDILHGRMPNAVPITDYVNVGDDLTMLIKVRHTADMESRVTNCIASDGSNESQQELIDNNGCTIDPAIMPNLNEKYNIHTGIKVIFTTFQAFKFPERDNLHLQCRILLCNNTCPLESCHRGYSRQRTRFTRSSAVRTSGNVVDEMSVFNSVEVKTPVVEVEKPNSKQNFLESASAMASFQEELFCLSSTRMVAIIAVLLGVLLISLVVTICMCVRARELRRRLIQRQSFPYGRVQDYS